MTMPNFFERNIIMQRLYQRDLFLFPIVSEMLNTLHTEKRNTLYLRFNNNCHIVIQVCVLFYLISYICSGQMVLWWTILMKALNFSKTAGLNCHNPRDPLTYFNDGGVRRILLGLTFWPKGIFLGLWKTPGFFWVAKTTEGFFGGIVFFISSNKK